MSNDHVPFHFNFSSLSNQMANESSARNPSSYSILKSAVRESKLHSTTPTQGERKLDKRPVANQSPRAKRAWEGSEVKVQLKDFLPALLQAAVDQSSWLDDFATETIVVSKDFHEVLATFHQLRQSERRRAA